MSARVEKIMRRAIYPGSFDPITNGHLDVLQRAAGLFDELVVGVAMDNAKQSLFTVEERVELSRFSSWLLNMLICSLNVDTLTLIAILM